MSTSMNSSGAWRSTPDIGPSDSSDSASELPEEMREIDSDRQATGERVSAEAQPDVRGGEDIDADREVPAEDAGLSHSPPDPVRNGGEPG